MNYVGIDLHKETSWFYVLNDKGQKLDSKNVSNKITELKKYFETIPKPFQLAVETTYNWYFMIDLAQEYTEHVYLANSYELKAFAKRNKKTDKIDAQLIASILQKGFLPSVTIANKHTREIRELLSCRIKLVSDRSRNIYRLKNLLDKIGRISTGDFTILANLKKINTNSLPSNYKIVIEQYKDIIIFLKKEIYKLDKEIAIIAQYDTDICNLLSIPGLGNFSALLVKSEIIDIKRFKSFNRLCAYAGLAPRVSASANKIHHGPLNKNRRKHLQWILLEVCFHFIKSEKKYYDKYLSIRQRKGHNTAKVALAREMLKVIYAVLKERRVYYRKEEIQSGRSLRSKGSEVSIH